MVNTSQARVEIKRQVKRWNYLVLHYGWEFDSIYCETPSDMPEGFQFETAAVTKSNPEYLKATIHWNLRGMADYDKEHIEEIVIHEITHILISPMWQWKTDESHELVVTEIARLFQGLRS